LFECTHDREGGVGGSGEHLEDAEFSVFEIDTVGEGSAGVDSYTQSGWLSYGGIRFATGVDDGRRMLEL
jgi:hypothetical protein